MAEKRYASVTELVRDVTDDPSFADEFENLMRERRLIRALLALRGRKGMSQKEIAAWFHCTQSRISKLEGSADGDLRFEDICKYAAALGLKVEIAFVPQGMTLVDRVKYHARQIKQLVDRLAGMVDGNKTLTNEAAHSFSLEVCEGD